MKSTYEEKLNAILVLMDMSLDEFQMQVRAFQMRRMNPTRIILPQPALMNIKIEFGDVTMPQFYCAPENLD